MAGLTRPFIDIDVDEALARPQKATRDGYGRAIVELGKLEPKMVCLDADLAESTRSAKFAHAYPDRFFNIGIAESNMVSWAAGLAAGGYKPWASTFAIFLACRAFEAVRQNVAYPALNVKLVASHGGISVGPDGASHQTVEDISLMRTLPNMTVIVPSDANEAYLAVFAANKINGPVFIRMGRANTPTLYDDTADYHIGKAVIHKEGTDLTICSTGIMLWRALKAAKLLAEKGIHARVVNLATIKPLDTEYVVACARETGLIVTVEEHSIIGGLGSAVTETVTDAHPCRVVRMGMRDTFGTSGDHNALFKHFKLEPSDIAAAAEAALREKTAQKA